MEISKEEENNIKLAIEGSRSMRSAAKKLGYSKTEFRNRAIKLNFWTPKYKGLTPANKLPIEDLIAGNTRRHSYGLKKRLIDEGLIKDECEACGWNKRRPNSKYSSCHLDHIDGNDENNKLDNLRLLCPNCHSLTSTYCRPKNPRNQYTGSSAAVAH